MPSPFPGMDPYLENPAHWRDVHNSLIFVIRERLNESLQPRYYALTEERVFVTSNEEPTQAIRPDASVHVAGSSPAPGEILSTSTAIETEPIEAITLLDEETREPYVVIYDGDDRRVVTIIEILSPTNKTVGEAGFASYRAKRLETMRSTTHFVEIDLLRSGRRMVAIPRSRAADYYVHLSRHGERPRGWIWPIPLASKLPTVRIPLLQEDEDVRLNLQAVFETFWKRSPYEKVIDYRQEPVPPLPAHYAAWADELLKSKGCR